MRDLESGNFLPGGLFQNEEDGLPMAALRGAGGGHEFHERGTNWGEIRDGDGIVVCSRVGEREGGEETVVARRVPPLQGG